MFYLLILLLCFCSFYSMESVQGSPFIVIFAQHPELKNPIKRDPAGKTLKIFYNEQLKLTIVPPVEGKDFKTQEKEFENFSQNIWHIESLSDKKNVNVLPSVPRLNINNFIGGITAIEDKNLDKIVLEKFRLKKMLRGTIDNFGLILMHFFITNVFKDNKYSLISSYVGDDGDGKLIKYYCFNFGFFNPPEKSYYPGALFLTKKEYIACLKGKFILLEDKFFYNCLYLKQFIMFLNENDIPYNIFSQQICKKA